MSLPNKPLSSTHSSDEQASKPWYREFWAWFILAPLILVVIVSSYTVSLAVNHADDRVIDDYYKEGRMINKRLDEDIAAANMNLMADIRLDAQLSELLVTLSNTSNHYPDAIVLEFSHPLDKTLDYQVQLDHIAKGRYQTELDRLLVHRWYLRLRPLVDVDSTLAADIWRLRGEIDLSQVSAVRLQSTL